MNTGKNELVAVQGEVGSRGMGSTAYEWEAEAKQVTAKAASVSIFQL